VVLLQPAFYYSLFTTNTPRYRHQENMRWVGSKAQEQQLLETRAGERTRNENRSTGIRRRPDPNHPTTGTEQSHTSEEHASVAAVQARIPTCPAGCSNVLAKAGTRSGNATAGGE
jgi:hypothetical protein